MTDDATDLRYGAIIDGEPGAYGIVVPDLPGCTAMGKTINEACDAAEAAARAWIAVTVAEGGTIPKPRFPLRALLGESPEDGMIVMISVENKDQ
jgi:predicted RNase H-like HicB family nuclease